MSTAKTFTEGVPAYLLESGLVGTHPWAQKGAKLVLKGERSVFTLSFKKLSNQMLEPWQRVGFWLTIDATVTFPAVVKLLGLKRGAATMRCALMAPQGLNPMIDSAWHTNDDTPDAIAEAVGARLAPVIDAMAEAIDHPLGVEAAAWTEVSIEVPWETPTRPLRCKALPWYQGEVSLALYTAGLLLRQDHASAAAFIAQLEARGDDLAADPKIVAALRQEITRQQEAGLSARPLVAVDWDFEALDASIAAAAAAALAAPVVHAAPAVEAPDAGSFWQVLQSAIRPADYHEEPDGLGFAEAPAALEWRVFCEALSTLPAHDQEAFAQHQDSLDATLSALPDAFRRTPFGDEGWLDLAAQGKPPRGWALARSLALETDARLDPALTASMRHLHLFDLENCHRLANLALPEVVEAEFAWTDLTPHHVEQLAEALPQLKRLRADIPDAQLGAIAGLPLVSDLELLDSRSSADFDKGLKALAKRKDLGLEGLSLRGAVKPPALKALIKSSWAPQLKQLQIGGSSPAGCKALLAALSGPLAGLKQLAVRTDVSLGETRLPQGLEVLHIQPDSLLGCVEMNPELPHERLCINSYGVGLETAESLARWPSAGRLAELELTVHENDNEPYDAFFRKLAATQWPALRNISLALYEAGDSACAGLAAWLDRCPDLVGLRISCYQSAITTEGAQTLAAAAAKVRYLELEVPTVFSVLSSQVWPNLVNLQISLAAQTSELTFPVQSAALNALGQQMPALRIAVLKGGELEAGAEGVVEALRALPHLLALELS